MSPAASGREHPRLNPFAFVSDTGLRFALLLALVSAADVRRWYGIGQDWGGLAPQVEECMFGPSRITGGDLLDAKLWLTLQPCIHITLAQQRVALALGLALLAVTTLGAYWLHPRRIVWQRGLSLLDPAAVPGLAPVLEEICQAAGLRRSPEFWWNPLDGRPGARAFGLPGRYKVMLTGGDVARFIKDPAAFRMVMLHELAHIRNGDVPLTYLTLSMEWAFAGTALLPYVVIDVVLARPGLPDLAILLAETALLAGLVILARNAVLRARELYADARSVTWQQDTEAFKRAIRRLPPMSEYRQLLSLHPAPSRRLRVLENTDEMFHFSSWDAVGIGAATAWAASTSLLASTMYLLVDDSGEGFGRLALAGAPAMAAVALGIAAVAVLVWRSTFRALMRGERPRGATRIGFALAAGVVLGGPALFLGAIVGLASRRASVGEAAQSLPWDSATIVLGIAVLAVALVVVLALTFVPLLKWLEGGATAWLPVVLAGSSPGASFWVGVAVSCTLVAPWLAGLAPLVGMGVAFMIKQIGFAGLGATLYTLAIAATVYPVALVSWPCLVWFWAFPLAAALRKPATPVTVPAWTYLDPVAGPTAVLGSPLRPIRVLLIGGLGGLCAAAALPWVGPTFAPTSLHGFGFAEHSEAGALFIALLLAAMVMQAALAALAGFAVPRLGVVHGMFAASVAGTVLAVSVTVQLRSHGVERSAGELFGVVFGPVVMGGALLALGCTAVACILKGAARAMRLREMTTGTNNLPNGEGERPQHKTT